MFNIYNALFIYYLKTKYISVPPPPQGNKIFELTPFQKN